MAVYGADADALDALAGQLDAKAKEIEVMHRQLGRQLHAAPWRGNSADRFRQRWSTEHALQVTLAAEFLRTGTTKLTENARQQREASGGDSGSTGYTFSPPPKPSDDADDNLPEWWDDMKRILKDLGLAKDAIDKLMKALGFLDEDLLKTFTDLLGGQGFLDFMKIAGDALDIAGHVVTFIETFAEKAQSMPWDEALVFSITTVAVGFAASKGIDFVASKAGAALGSAIPVAGTAAGYLIGKAVGWALSKGFEYLDGEYNVTENIADFAVEEYRNAKEIAENVGEVIENIGEGVGKIADGAKDVGEEFIDVVTFWN